MAINLPLMEVNDHDTDDKALTLFK